MAHAGKERAGDESAGGNEPARSRASAWRRPAVRSAFGLALLLGIPVAGQNPPFEKFPATNGAKFQQQYPDTSGLYDQNSNSPEQKRVQVLNAQRQKALVSDTEKLLKLAQDLNHELATPDSDQLSEEQVRKVGEIGKLAKSVKDKMSYTLGGYAPLNTPLTVPPGIQ